MPSVSQTTRNFKSAIGFYNIPAPKPAADLRIFLDGQKVIKLHVKGENFYRWPSQAMTMDHPFIQEFLTGYTFNEEYPLPNIGLAVRAYYVVSQVEEVEEVELSPKPTNPALEIAAFLTSEYPELAGRIQKGLELYQAGAVEFTQYQTSWDPAGFYGTFSCQCPDSQHRNPRSRYGVFCKHAVAQFIAKSVEQERKAVAYRKLADRIERDRARIAATQAGCDAALKPDPINRKASHVAQFGKHLPK